MTIQAHTAAVSAIDFSRDNSKICTGSHDKSIKVRETLWA